MTVNNIEELLELVNIDLVKQLAVNAGKEILKYYKQNLNIEYKDDDSPLTIADKKANELICNTLQSLYSDIPILSEENESIDYELRKSWQYYWCIDPLDGTRGFIKQTDEFTVNIALMCLNRPILGVVYAPYYKKLYYAQKNTGAFLEFFDQTYDCSKAVKLPCIDTDKSTHKIVISSSRMPKQIEDYIQQKKQEYSDIKVATIGSSLKLCMVAEGTFDSCPLFYKTMEWDIAASEIILIESGKKLVNVKKSQIKEYNQKSLANSHMICR